VIRYEKRNMPPLPTHMDTQKKRNTSQMPQMPKTIPRNKKMSKKLTDEEIKKLPERQQKWIQRNRRILESNREKANKISREQYYKHIDKRRAYEKKRLAKQVPIHKEYRRKIKEECLSHYCKDNIKCAKCGITILDVLTIDHINGNGRQERKTNCKGRGGDRFYQYLRRNNYPSGYQVLCFNCNFLEAINKGFLITNTNDKKK